MAYSIKREQTQKRINEAFLALLREKPLPQITVKEICVQAAINRSTFYTYYMDVNDLYEHLAEETMAQMVQVVNDFLTHHTSWAMETVLEQFVYAMQENEGRAFLFMMRDQESWMQRIIQAVKDGMVFDQQGISEAAMSELECVIEYHLSGAMAVLTHRLKQQPNVDIDSLLPLIARAGMEGPLTILMQLFGEAEA